MQAKGESKQAKLMKGRKGIIYPNGNDGRNHLPKEEGKKKRKKSKQASKQSKQTKQASKHAKANSKEKQSTKTNKQASKASCMQPCKWPGAAQKKF